MFNERTTIVLTGQPSNLLIVITLVTKQNFDFSCVTVDKRWRDLRVVFSSRRHVQIEDRVRSCIDQQRDFQPLNRQLRPLCVVL